MSISIKVNGILKEILLEDYEDIGHRTETWSRWLSIFDAKKIRDKLDKAIKELESEK